MTRERLYLFDTALRARSRAGAPRCRGAPSTSTQNAVAQAPRTRPMVKERLYLFDTTLRDGAQTTGVDFSLEDKRLIAAHAR